MRAHLRKAVLFLIFWSGVSALQWRAQAFQAEFGFHPDEPAHYVTGLMVRDYIAAGFPGSPLAFARNYYLHYPKVALGHWPPFFYVVQSIWTLLFTPSRISIMLLMGAITALVATIVAEALRRKFSLIYGVFAGMIFVSLPAVAQFSSAVMSEELVALLVLLAVLAYGRFLETESHRWGAWFGVWCTFAILTKGDAIQLVLVPPFAIVATGRWRLLRRFSFWLPALIVLCFAAPWYLFVPGAQHEKVARFGGIEWKPERFVGSIHLWVGMLGVIPAIAAAAGLVICALKLRRRETSGLWAAAIGVLLGAYIFRVGIGAFEDRHLVIDLPVLLILAAAAVHAIPKPIAWIAVLASIIVIAFNFKEIPAKLHYGYSEVAARLIANPRLKESVILVCSSATGEGMLISEIAMRERRPGHFVLRASKMLASSDWMGWDYRLLYHDPEEVFRFLHEMPVGVVVIDPAGIEKAHGILLEEAIANHSASFRKVAESGTITAYELTDVANRQPGPIHIPMHSGLFRSFDQESPWGQEFP